MNTASVKMVEIFVSTLLSFPHAVNKPFPLYAFISTIRSIYRLSFLKISLNQSSFVLLPVHGATESSVPSHFSEEWPLSAGPCSECHLFLATYCSRQCFNFTIAAGTHICNIKNQEYLIMFLAPLRKQSFLCNI